MNPREFLILAQQLSLATTEAAWRATLGRAYYAAFHVAKQLLEELGFAVPRADRAHAYLWLRLANCGDAQVQQAGNELNELRRDRNWADYDLRRPIRQVVIQQQMPITVRIIHVFEAAAIEPTRTTITNAMKIYERDVLRDVTWHP